MIRIHLLALPRSGTTALSKGIAEKLGLPVIREPVFLWTDGFRVDLEGKDLPGRFDLRRINEKIETLGRIFETTRGFVEKTPSSVFLAPVMDDLVRDSIIVVITRDRDEIVQSIERMIFENQDGNISTSSSFRVHKLKRRSAKIILLFQILGVKEGIVALLRAVGWARRNSVSALCSRDRVKRYVDDAQARLARLKVGETNRVVTIPYERFRDEPDAVIEQIATLCEQPCDAEVVGSGAY